MNQDQETTAARSSGLSDEAIVNAICNNMYEHYLRFGTTRAGSFCAEPDLKWARSGRSVSNYLLGADFEPAQARERIAQVTQMVRSWHANAQWKIGPEAAPTDFFDLATDCGWAPVSPCAGMAIRLDRAVPEVSLPDGLTISIADDEESLRTWAGIYFAEAPEGLRNTVADVFCEVGCGPHLPWTYYIGWVDGKAVASSLVYCGAGVAGLYYIGTLSDYRRRGIGTAVTEFSVKQAQDQGHSLVILQATDMGASVYRRVGFREYCTIKGLMLRA